MASLFYDLNHAPIWQREVHVWGRRMKAASLDRLVFLGLHRCGLMGSGERELLAKLVQPGMQIVDIGANIGLYALMLAQLTGKTGHVFAFEPEPNLFDVLRKNCAVNGGGTVTVHQKALGKENGRATFQRSAFNSGNNCLGSAAETGGERVEVEVARLDDVLPARRVDFIKLDVQGHEVGVLQGMEQVLAGSPGVQILFELWPAGLRRAGSSPEELIGFFTSRGFHLYEAEDVTLRPLTNPAGLLAGLTGQRFTNLLAKK